MARAALPALVTALCSLAASGTAGATPYSESGDAGDRSSPQATAGVGILTEIHGTLGTPGGPGDTRDAFVFGYGGAPGVLEIRAAFDDPLLGVIFASLLDAQGGLVIDGESLMATDLAAGSYIIELAIDDDGPDPPYTIVFDGPEEGGAGFAVVPEPGTLTLVAGGMLLLSLRGRGGAAD